MPKDEPAGEPALPGDLPPLPSPYFRPRPKEFACPECGREFATAAELNEHARRRHDLALPAHAADAPGNPVDPAAPAGRRGAAKGARGKPPRPPADGRGAS